MVKLEFHLNLANLHWLKIKDYKYMKLIKGA